MLASGMLHDLKGESDTQNMLTTVLERPSSIQKFQHTLQFRRQLDRIAARNYPRQCRESLLVQPLERSSHHSSRTQGQAGKDGSQSSANLARPFGIRGKLGCVNRRDVEGSQQSAIVGDYPLGGEVHSPRRGAFRRH